MTAATQQFLDHEISVWGEDYIFDLIDRGYRAVETTAGCRWLAPALVPPGAHRPPVAGFRPGAAVQGGRETATLRGPYRASQEFSPVHLRV